MSSVWLRMLPYIIALTVAAAGVLGSYRHGLSVKEAEWKVKWSDRDTADARAIASAEALARSKEYDQQQKVNKVIEDGQKIIDQAVADADAARVYNGVRAAADAAARRVEANQTGNHSCTAAASQAATRAALVLTDVLKRVDKRAEDLAADADQSRSRGVICAKAYDEIADTKNANVPP